MSTHSKTVLTVTQLNNQVKFRLEDQFSHIWLEGEVSAPRCYSSGHTYLTLKDSQSEISCVLFAGKRQSLDFEPVHGQKVLVSGSISLYLPRGQYQFIIDHMYPTGVGELWVAYEQLKKKLQGEGLFDPQVKKVLPRFPGKIGVATSASGAVVRDIINVLGRRAPQVQILVRPTLVQGAAAVPDLVAALQELNGVSDIDVIIIGRGGGSLEDLWCFNDESVARAIYASRIPVVSAVGHETDYTISDFVADLRAPTPSAAAEVCAPARSDLYQMLDDQFCRLSEIMTSRIQQLHERVSAAEKHHGYFHPINQLEKHQEMLLQYSRRLMSVWQEKYLSAQVRIDKYSRMLQEYNPHSDIRQYQQQLNFLGESLKETVNGRVRQEYTAVAGLQKLLVSLHPEEVLKRGFAMVKDRNGHPVSDPDILRKDDPISVKFAGGEVGAIVTKTLEETKNESQ